MRQLRACLRILLVAAGATFAFSPRGLGEAGAAQQPAAVRVVSADAGRRPNGAVPERYALQLWIDPAAARFSGVMTIQVALPEATPMVVLDGRDIHVVAAHLLQAGDDQTADVSVRRGASESAPSQLAFEVKRPLRAGRAVVQIVFDAPFAEGTVGVYRTKVDGEWYAVTDFGDADARRAFPCFDEPSRKAAFDLSITTPPGAIAVANAPLASTSSANGRTTFHFETTPPLDPSALGFAVGPFDVYAGPNSPVPVRLFAPKGEAGQGASAMSLAAALVREYEGYLGVGLPTGRLDLVAVPGRASLHSLTAGLVALREEDLLVDGAGGAGRARLRLAGLLSHAIAHQWFGGVVSPASRDDAWLTEALAVWLEGRALDRVDPNYGGRVQAVVRAQRAMDEDSLLTARPIRRDLTGSLPAASAMDEITAGKGAAVLSMVEAQIGEDAFRRGIEHYLREHAFGGATASDLFRSLDYVSAGDARAVAFPLLSQAGAPSVMFTRRCGGRRGGLSLMARAGEWTPFSVPMRATRSWTLPVCVTADGVRGTTCGLLATKVLALESGSGRCPLWVAPNAEMGAYYRVTMPESDWRDLGRVIAARSERDRVGFVANLWAAVRDGSLSPSVYFELLPALDRDTSRFVIEEVTASLRAVSDALVEPVVRGAFERYVKERLRWQKRRLGWEAAVTARGAFADGLAIARADVLSTLALLARDDETLLEAESYTNRWLDEPDAVSGDVASVAVAVAALRGGGPLFVRLRGVAGRARTPQLRAIAVRAMAASADPSVLEAAFNWILGDVASAADVVEFLSAVGQYPGGSSAEVLYWKRHPAAFLTRARIEGEDGVTAVALARGLCTEDDIESAKALLLPPAAGALVGGDRVARALEADELCVAFRKHSAAAASRWFLARR